MFFKRKSKKSVLLRFSLLIPVLLFALAFQEKLPTAKPCTEIDKLIEVSTTIDRDTTFAKPEIPPSPKGGMNEFYQYIGQNYRYPKAAVDAKVEGKVLISFVVERDGCLTDIKILKDLGYGTGEEAVRMLKGSPKWTPGMQKGEPVRVRFTLPIQLNKKKEPEKTQKHG